MNESTIHSTKDKIMKKIIAFMLMAASLIGVCAVVNSSTAQEENVEASASTAVADLFAKYYNDGRYTKNSKIYIDDNNEELKEEISEYFHAKVAELEKTTYYSKDALWMTREDGTYSYYGTAYEGDIAVGVTHGTATEAYKAPASLSVVLSGVNQNSMEEYYCTLEDFIEGVHTSSHNGTDEEGNNKSLTLNELWTENGGVYYNVDEDVLNGFRLFTAPLWLDTPESRNYISFSLATVEEVGNDLVMKLWTSIGDVTKLIGTETLEYADQTYYLFSEASIHGHVWVEKTIEPTCVATGERYQECECGERESLAVLPKLALETTIDGEKGDFYDGIQAITGKRTLNAPYNAAPYPNKLSHESYVKLGKNGIYVYQYIEDGALIVKDRSHVELYFTLGDTAVLDKSFAVHVYANSTSPLRSYTYSTAGLSNRTDALAKQYCYYSVKTIENGTTVGRYAVELFVDYSYFGITEAPEFVNIQFRAVSGENNPLTNNKAGGLAYTDIANHIKCSNPEIFVDGKMDEKYTSLTPLTSSRTQISQEVYVYLGKKGVYVYQLVTDTKAITPSKTASQLYVAVGDTLTATNAFGVYCYFDSTTTDPFRTYRFSESSGSYGRKSIGQYPDYCSLKVIETGNGITKYAYEMFFEYSLFGIDSAPETVKLFAVARSYNGAAIANGNVTGDGGMKDITKYATFGKNGLVK